MCLVMAALGSAEAALGGWPRPAQSLPRWPSCPTCFVDAPCALQEGAKHTHSSDVTSVGIEAEGQLVYPKVQSWLNKLLQVGGPGVCGGGGQTLSWHVPMHEEQRSNDTTRQAGMCYIMLHSMQSELAGCRRRVLTSSAARASCAWRARMTSECAGRACAGVSSLLLLQPDQPPCPLPLPHPSCAPPKPPPCPALALPCHRPPACRHVFQGVHMLVVFSSSAEGAGRPWAPGERRLNRVVFIGRHLDREGLNASFRACLASPAAAA
jgi:hypothetical protein